MSVGLTEANVDADIFNLWLLGDLIPKLPPAAVLVMDRATFHRRADTKAAIAAAGHTLEYLPAYSPELNDIEHKWAEAKAYRRKSGDSVDDVFSKQNWNQNCVVRLYLFIVDGAKALSKALHRTFGADIPIQRCQIHKARTIIDRLPLTVCLPSIMPPCVAP